MNRHVAAAGALALALTLSACAEAWAPPPGDNGSDLSVQAAQCRLFARGSAPSGGFIAASGSPRFVGTTLGAYALGSAIGAAIAIHQNYDDCMQARGWTLVAHQ